MGNGGRNPPKRNFAKLSNRKQKLKHEQWQRVQKNKKETITQLSKWIDKSSKELKATSAYLLEHQVEVNSQLFKAHDKNAVKDRAEFLKHTSMLNGTLAAAWRTRHEVVKLEIARLPVMYHRTAWSLVRHAYFKLWAVTS